ncbi:MAG: 16S rRNA (uracil(1498)-N(3))-methyltransferase [Fibrobacteres bacterium]|nr:16S rRNA (uracil(1498)-N(3))-methyltransferase [Fibrobacterota bacterium]
MNIILLDKNETNSDGSAKIDGRRFLHISKVLKSKIGDSIRIGVIDGLCGTGTISEICDNSIIFKTEFSKAAPSPLPITLLLALPRPKAFRRTLETAVTMGVKRIFVLNSSNVEKSYWDSPFLTPEALRERMLLGLEQAGDTIIPQLTLCRSFETLINDNLKDIIKDSTAVIAGPSEVNESQPKPNGQITLCVGPDRGFTAYEQKRFIESGFVQYSLGSRTLRVEQAVPALIGRLSAE